MLCNKPILQENSPTLVTQRLVLRRFTPADVPAYFAIVGDQKANRYLPWFTVQTQAEAAAMLEEKYLSTYQQPTGYRYAICLHAEGQPIGYCNFSGDASADVGYALRCEYWGQGIATEAAGAMIQRIEAAGYPYVTATHDVHNPGSGAVMKKLGMCYQYSYREQWQPKNIPVTFRLYQRCFGDTPCPPYQAYWEAYPHFIEENL